MRSPVLLAVLLLSGALLGDAAADGGDEPGLADPAAPPAVPEPAPVTVTAQAEPAPPVESAGRRHGHRFRADPFLISLGAGIGVEPSDRGNQPGDGALDLFFRRSPATFHFNAEALWRGLFGLGLGLYASEGQPVAAGKDAQGATKPSLGDRVSVVGAAAVRPLAFLAWNRGDDYLGRLLAGIGLELGASVEIVRTALDQSVAPGFHALLFVEVPLWGGGSTGGVTFRLSGRLLVTREARLAVDSTSMRPQVISPGTSGQLFAGFSFYL